MPFWPILLIVGGVILLGFEISRSSRPVPAVSELPAQPSPSETAAAPGTGVFAVPEEGSKPTGNYIERSPITLVDNTTGSTSDTAQPPATSAPEEVPDIYDFLKSAPRGRRTADHGRLRADRRLLTSDRLPLTNSR